jgi:hypothetical protein
MANRGYAFSLNMRIGLDENADTRAWAQASFVVLDDNGVVVKTQYDAEIMALETVDPVDRADTVGQRRAKLEVVARDVWQDQDLEFEWQDEG